MRSRPLLVIRRLLATVLLAAGVLGALFVVNGTSEAWRSPQIGGPAARATDAPEPDELVVVAWNLAKLGFHRGGVSFTPRAEIERRLDAVADELRAMEPDLVFLSEMVAEGGPVDVDQVRGLAERLDLPWHAFGENYRFGIPGFRIRSGNALLSRWPLTPGEVLQLTGERPFWSPTGNRRLLRVDVELPGGSLRVGSLRNDSFDLANNAAQVRQILEHLGREPTLLAGDLNAEPGDESLRLLEASGRFVAGLDGEPTYPARAPTRRIDAVLVPQGWELLEERVPATELSDHRPVVVRLRRSGP